MLRKFFSFLSLLWCRILAKELNNKECYYTGIYRADIFAHKGFCSADYTVMDRLQRLTRFSQNGYFGDFCHVLADGLLFGRRDCLAIINRNGSQNGQVHSRRKSLKSIILHNCIAKIQINCIEFWC